MLDIHGFSSRYTVRRADEMDCPAILKLCEGNSLYYQHCPPAPSLESIREDLKLLPNGKTEADKYFLCYFHNHTMIAVLDLIDGYPDPQTAFIGFFMMEQGLQGKGVGTAIIAELCEALKPHFSHIRLGYVSTNEQSKHFWHKNGFLPTGITVQQERYKVVVLQKEL